MRYYDGLNDKKTVYFLGVMFSNFLILPGDGSTFLRWLSLAYDIFISIFLEKKWEIDKYFWSI